MSKDFTEILLGNRHRFGDILDFAITESNSLPLDLTHHNKALTSDIASDASAQERYVFGLLRESGTRVGVGGYLEERVIYRRSQIFTNSGDERNIHLGVDLWIEKETPVFAPLEGEVYSVKNNVGLGDYGPTIIVKHRIGDFIFYTLYGHLSEGSLGLVQVGDRIRKGDKLCEIGTYPSNGDYAPHLHFQIITDLEDYRDGNYPGVCSQSDLGKFARICPNPNLILRIPSLG